MSSSEHSRRAIFQIYNVQNLKITRITTFRICNVVYQAGSRWDPKCVFNFLRFFERTLLSWCGTHTKIRSKLILIWSQCVVPRSAVPSVRSSLYQLPDRTEQVLTRAGRRVEVVASLSQGRTAAAQCGLFTHKSVPVIFEPPFTLIGRNANFAVPNRPNFLY